MVELKRGFGFWTVLSLSIGSIMGTAIFFGASIGARYSGNLALVAWVILSLVSIYIAACFGELVSMFPKSGGVYEFSKQTYGRFTSFMTGWAAWLVGNISVAVLIVASINIIMPKSSIAVKFLLSSGIILALNLVALLGLEATSLISIGFAVAIVSVIVALVGRGLFAMNLDNLMPLVTHSPLSIFLTMFFLLETYFGWESATYLAEETKDPRKTIPRAIVAGTIVIAVLGFGMLIISLGVIGYQGLAGLGNESPTVILAHQLFGSNGAALIIAGIVLALIGSAASGIITMPRLVLAMARDKLFIEQLKAIHPRFNTPYKAIIFQSIVTVLLLFMVLGNYQLLLSILVPLAALMYIPVILSVTILRHRSPNAERPFKVPFGKVGPVIVSLFLLSTILIESLADSSGFNLLRLSISIIMIGIPLYFLVELYFDPKMITDVSD
ncbi:amino acid permease, partial [Candidatus Woesearchaeota archaeon]|nr:amino acid permease [Candidatus Woesearchaeota archaeon]